MFRKYIKRFFKCFCFNPILNVLFICAYVLGVVLGIIFGKGLTQFTDLFVIVNNYHTMIIGLYSNPIKLTFTRIFNNLFYFLLLWILCCTIFTSCFTLIMFFYRGLVLGNVFFLFFQIYSVHGIIIYIFIVVMQNVIVTFGLLYASCIVYDMRLKRQKGYCSYKYFRFFLIGFLISLFGAFYELTILVIFFRPLNLYF